MKKRSFILAILLLVSNIFSVSANEVTLSDSEYEAQVAGILSSYSADPETAKQELAKLNTTLIAEPVVTDSDGNALSRGTSPSDYTLTASIYKRGNSNRYYLQWVLTANAREWFPGPLDYVGLEWDTTYGSYYTSTAGGDGCTIKGRDTGIVLFNVEDDKLNKNEYYYGSIQVEPVKSGWMEFGVKFAHTYTSFAVTGSATTEFAPSVNVSNSGGASLGLEHTKSFTVTVGAKTNEWELWADNAGKV